MQRIQTTLALLFALALLSLAAIGCGETSTITGNPVDGDTVSDGDGESESEGDLNVIIDGDDDKDADIEYDGPIWPEEGNSYRLSMVTLVKPQMTLTEPISIDINQSFNDYVNGAILDGELNVIMIPKTDNLQAFPYEMDANMAEMQGDTLVIDPENGWTATVVAGAEPRSFVTETGMSVTLPLSSEGMEDITIYEITVSGTYSETLASISKGALGGVLREEDAKKIEVYQGATLDMLLAGMSVFPDYTFENGDRGYKFILTWRARAATVEEGTLSDGDRDRPPRPDGDEPDGDVIDGDTIDGDTVDGDTTELGETVE